MKFYEERVFPLLNDLLTSSFINHRKRVLRGAAGELLEIGFGSGISLPAYNSAKVARLVGLEPNAGMLEKANQVKVANIKLE